MIHSLVWRARLHRVSIFYFESPDQAAFIRSLAWIAGSNRNQRLSGPLTCRFGITFPPNFRSPIRVIMALPDRFCAKPAPYIESRCRLTGPVGLFLNRILRVSYLLLCLFCQFLPFLLLCSFSTTPPHHTIHTLRISLFPILYAGRLTDSTV